MSNISIKLEKRTATGKKVAQLRRDGFVPSVVYGGQNDPIDTQSGIVETTKVAHTAGKHSPVDIEIDGKKTAIEDIESWSPELLTAITEALTNYLNGNRASDSEKK